jgi:hypothetical protein
MTGLDIREMFCTAGMRHSAVQWGTRGCCSWPGGLGTGPKRPQCWQLAALLGCRHSAPNAGVIRVDLGDIFLEDCRAIFFWAFLVAHERKRGKINLAHEPSPPPCATAQSPTRPRGR